MEDRNRNQILLSFLWQFIDPKHADRAAGEIDVAGVSDGDALRRFVEQNESRLCRVCCSRPGNGMRSRRLSVDLLISKYSR